MNKYVISDVLKIREEILREKQIEGVIQTYNIIKDGKFNEKSPEWVFNHTFPSQSLVNIIEKINEKIRGKEKRGTFIFMGGWGSGKSHNLLVIYHLFQNYPVAKKWLEEWKIDFELPKKDFHVILLPLHYDALEGKDLWEPIFEKLGKKSLLAKLKTYPAVKHIEELIGERNVVLVIDEIERWYNGLDSKQQEKNLNFIESLAEVSTSKNLFIILALREKTSKIFERLKRVNPITQDLTAFPDVERIVIFRFFEEAEKINKKIVEKIVEGYISAYQNAELDIRSEEYKSRMFKTYPFQPEIFEILFKRYTTAKDYQNTRGVLYLLLPVLLNCYDKKDLIKFSDINFSLEEVQNQARQINRILYEKALVDINSLKEIKFATELISIIFFYSVGEVKELGASKKDILLGILTPEIKSADVLDSLDKIHRMASHVWPIDAEKYLIKEEIRGFAVIETKADKLLMEARDRVYEKIKEIITDEILYTPKTFIYKMDEIKDDPSIKVVLTTHSPVDEKERNEMIKEIYSGIKYGNTIVLILPKVGVNILEDEDILKKAARIVSASDIIKKREVEKEKIVEIEEIRKKDIKELKEDLINKYGLFVKCIKRTEEGIEYRLESCEIRPQTINKKIEELSVRKLIEEESLEILKEIGKKTITFRNLLDIFYTQLGRPLIKNREELEDVLSELCAKGKIAIFKEDGTIIFEKQIPRIDDKMEIILKEFLPKGFSTQPKSKIKEILKELPRGTLEKPEIKKIVSVEKPPIPPEELLESAGNPAGLLHILETKYTDESLTEELEITLEEKFKRADVLEKLENFVKKINLVGVKEVESKIKIKLEGSYSMKELKEKLNQLPDISEGRISIMGKVRKK